MRFLGGTFYTLPAILQTYVFQTLYHTINTIDNKKIPFDPYATLSETVDHHINGSGPRIVALSIEQRPDCINKSVLDKHNEAMVIFVEMGMQSTDDDVLKFNNRGHGVKDSEKAMWWCKQAGFKTMIHAMPDLPSSSPEIDLKCFEDTLVKPVSQSLLHRFARFILGFITIFFHGELVLRLCSHFSYCVVPLFHRADHIKLYPTLNLPYTQISKWGKDKWDSYTEKEGGAILLRVCSEIVAKIPPWMRPARIQRDMPKASEKNGGLGFTSDVVRTDLGDLITRQLKQQHIYPQDIKSREPRKRCMYG